MDMQCWHQISLHSIPINQLPVLFDPSCLDEDKGIEATLRERDKQNITTIVAFCLTKPRTSLETQKRSPTSCGDGRKGATREQQIHPLVLSELLAYFVETKTTHRQSNCI